MVPSTHRMVRHRRPPPPRRTAVPPFSLGASGSASSGPFCDMQQAQGLGLQRSEVWGQGAKGLCTTYTGEPAGQMSCRQRPMWPMTWSTSSTEPSRRLQAGPRSYSRTSCKGAAESSRRQQAAVKGPVHKKHSVCMWVWGWGLPEWACCC